MPSTPGTFQMGARHSGEVPNGYQALRGGPESVAEAPGGLELVTDASGSAQIVVRSFQEVPNGCQTLRGGPYLVPEAPEMSKWLPGNPRRFSRGDRRSREVPNGNVDAGRSQLGARQVLGPPRSVWHRVATSLECLAPSCDLPGSSGIHLLPGASDTN